MGSYAPQVKKWRCPRFRSAWYSRVCKSRVLRAGGRKAGDLTHCAQTALAARLVISVPSYQVSCHRAKVDGKNAIDARYSHVWHVHLAFVWKPHMPMERIAWAHGWQSRATA